MVICNLWKEAKKKTKMQTNQDNNNNSNNKNSANNNNNKTKKSNRNEQMKDPESRTIEIEETCPANSEMAGKANICKGCPGAQLCQSLQQSQIVNEDEKMRVRMNAISKKIMIASGKGGVGKSTLTALLSFGLAERKLRCGLLDTDLCGPSTGRLLGISQRVVMQSWGWQAPTPESHPSHLLLMSTALLSDSSETPIIWRGPRKTATISKMLRETFWGKLDILLIDTPPGTSDEHLATVTALRPYGGVDGVILVTTNQKVALDALQKEISFCKRMGLAVLGIVVNMSGFVCPCCDEVSDLWEGADDAVDHVAKEFGVEILAKIPMDPKLTEKLDHGGCPFCNSKGSVVLKEINLLIDKIFK